MTRYILLGLAFTLAMLGTPRAWAQRAPEITEPSPREVTRAALRASGLLRPTDWTSRMRLSHLIPEVDVRGGWDQRRDDALDYREDQTLDGIGALRRDFVRQEQDIREQRRQTYQVRLRWQLSGLVFDPRELQAARHDEATRQARRRLEAEVLKVYFERRRRLVERTTLGPDMDDERRALDVEIAWRTARLDALTRGWFVRTLRARRSP